MTGTIRIENKVNGVTEIDIEGLIGVPEAWQFDEPSQKTSTYDKFTSQLDAIRGIRTEEVVVNIRSTGGNVNDALLIHDSLCSLNKKITTRCYGYVASAATIIAQAGSLGRRQISENALYLIHRSTSTAEGNAACLAQAAQLLGKTDDRIASIYASRSGKPKAGFVSLMNENEGNGRWLTPAEAKAEGLVDRVIAAAPVSNEAARMVEELDLPGLPASIANKSKTMNIKDRWKSVLELLGAVSNKENPLSEDQIGLLDEELRLRAEKIAELQEVEVQNRQLKERINQLEVQHARLRAKATRTKPKEDPSAAGFARSHNEEAYSRDVRKFKKFEE